MQRQFTATFLKRGKWYLGWVEEIPGVNTQGRTLRSARASLREALQLVLSANRTILGRELRRVRRIREPLHISIPA